MRRSRPGGGDSVSALDFAGTADAAGRVENHVSVESAFGEALYSRGRVKTNPIGSRRKKEGGQGDPPILTQMMRRQYCSPSLRCLAVWR